MPRGYIDWVTQSMKVARAELLRAMRELSDHLASFALLDIDLFTELNETGGKELGDRCLTLVAETLKDTLPGEALFDRIGGDEFGVLLRGTTAEEALLVLDATRNRVDEESRRQLGVTVTVSVGIAEFPAHVGVPGDMMGASDEALFRAKQQGRNRIALFVEDKMTLKSNYYSKAQLSRLALLAKRMGCTEASLLREALVELLDRHHKDL